MHATLEAAVNAALDRVLPDDDRPVDADALREAIDRAFQDAV